MFIKHGKVKLVNGDNQNDRLEKLKAKYELEIQAKERELQKLKASYATLLAFGQEAEKLDNPKSEPNKYTGKGMTESILDALNCTWPSRAKDGRGTTAREIADYMIAHGFSPSEENPHNFNIAVAVTLKRLAEGNRVHKFTEGDGNFYKPVGKIYSAVKKWKISGVAAGRPVKQYIASH